MRVTELLEVQFEEGPCFECSRIGLPVVNQPLASADARWPRFAPMARESGFQMVHAVPLRLRDEVIGAMNVFDTSLHEMTVTESNLLRAFADAATIGILQERTVKQHSDLSGPTPGRPGFADRGQWRAGKRDRGRALEGRHGHRVRDDPPPCPEPRCAAQRGRQRARSGLAQCGRSLASPTQGGVPAGRRVCPHSISCER